jgi:hypothetical protein
MIPKSPRSDVIRGWKPAFGQDRAQDKETVQRYFLQTYPQNQFTPGGTWKVAQAFHFVILQYASGESEGIEKVGTSVESELLIGGLTRNRKWA